MNPTEKQLIDTLKALAKEVLSMKRDMEALRTSVLEDPTRPSVEKISTKLALQLAQLEKGDTGEKGDPGETPTKEELVSLIEPLIPDPIPGPQGPAGKDSTVPGPMGPRGPQGEPGLNGKDADETAIVAKIEGDLPALGTAVRDGLELLQGDERLDKSAIKGLEKIDGEITALKGRVQTPAKAYRINTADVSSQCDGVNKTFSVGGTHFGIVGVFGTEFPQIYRPVVDYTQTLTGIVLGSTIAAPQTGQTLVIQFLK